MKKYKNNFLECVYKSGKLKDVSEAFKEYPTNEEWHKGEIENVIGEPKEFYSYYEIGDIVFVKDYEYSTKEKGNNHLFVIIDKNNMAIPIENIAMLISSKIKKADYEGNILLPKSEKNGLKVDSIVKTDVVYKILNSQILFKIGTIDEDTIRLYKDSYNLVAFKNK